MKSNIFKDVTPCILVESELWFSTGFCLVYSLTMKMEAVYYSETTANFYRTGHHIRENTVLLFIVSQIQLKKLNSVALVRERTIPTERPPPVFEVMPTFADRGCRVVSATESHGR
jgi:hypothetical protein